MGLIPLIPSKNLSDLANAATALTNLGLGTAAAHAATDFDAAGAAAAVTPSTLSLVVGTNTQAHSVKLDTFVALADAAGWLHSNGSGVYTWSAPSKSDVGLGNAENTAISTWSGSTNLATLGTIVTGAWHGSTVGVAYGGTGATTLTAHGVLLGEGTSAVVATAAMTDGQLVVGQSGADPLPKTLSGDATLAASGAMTLANGGSTRTNLGLIGGADVLGDGSDGAVTISGNTTLARHMNYSSLTVNNGVTLSTLGFKIHCTGKVDTSTSGVIDCSGGAATNGADGIATGTGSAAGSAGVSAYGVAISLGTCGIIKGGGAGGRFGGSPASAANGLPGTNSAVNLAEIYGGASTSFAGAGGNAAAGANTGGTGGQSIFTSVGTSKPRVFTEYNQAFSTGFSATMLIGAGASAGGSGASTTGAGGGASGGGGAGGGIVNIIANEIAGTGTISAKGGAGGNGGAAYAGAGNAGGGGGSNGGDGGLLALFYNVFSFSGTLSVAGGAFGTGGAGHGTGTGGGNGSAGATGQIWKYNFTTRAWE